MQVAPLSGLVHDWPSFLAVAPADVDLKRLRQHERAGRPLGSAQFLAGLEKKLGRVLRPKKPGPQRAEK